MEGYNGPQAQETLKWRLLDDRSLTKVIETLERNVDEFVTLYTMLVALGERKCLLFAEKLVVEVEETKQRLEPFYGERSRRLEGGITVHYVQMTPSEEIENTKVWARSVGLEDLVSSLETYESTRKVLLGNYDLALEWKRLSREMRSIGDMEDANAALLENGRQQEIIGAKMQVVRLELQRRNRWYRRLGGWMYNMLNRRR